MSAPRTFTFRGFTLRRGKPPKDGLFLVPGKGVFRKMSGGKRIVLVYPWRLFVAESGALDPKALR